MADDDIIHIDDRTQVTGSRYAFPALRETVLIFSQQRNLARFLKSVLKYEGFVVHTTSDVNAVSDLLKKNKYSLIIIDSSSAYFEYLIKFISDEFSALPILIITTEATEEKGLRYLKLGAADFIKKPFTVDDIIFIVRDVIARQVDGSSVRGLSVKSALKGWVELTTANNYEYVARFRRFISVLFESNLNDEIKEDIRVAVDELGRNAVEWGNRHDPNKQIHLSYCLFADRIVLKIEDEGDGFDTSKLGASGANPLEIINQRLAEGKRPGGFGSDIVKRIMDEIHYNEKGNIVFLIKYFNEDNPK